MCTFNIALDDKLVDTVRSSFPNMEEMTTWMQEQLTFLLSNYTPSTESASVNSLGHNIRKARKHDALMGIISDNVEEDYKRIHLREKYGV